MSSVAHEREDVSPAVASEVHSSLYMNPREGSTT